jgi:hypothetical protein
VGIQRVLDNEKVGLLAEASKADRKFRPFFEAYLKAVTDCRDYLTVRLEGEKR